MLRKLTLIAAVAAALAMPADAMARGHGLGSATKCEAGGWLCRLPVTAGD
jgi:hypothetical protein